MPFRTRDLGFGARLGLTGALLALLLGFGASAAHLYWHYENRDERPGMTLDDIRAAYRGISAPSLLASALERGHPPELKPESREALLKWLRSGSVSEAYDSLDLGADAPAERIAASCVSCHARGASAAQPAARALPLETWDDVKKLAFARNINPAPKKVIAASSHAHALAMGTMTLMLGALGFASRLPRTAVGGLVGVTGVALLADVGSWWLAPYADAFVYVIAASGFAYNGGSVALILLLIADLWLPRAAPARGAPA